MSTALPSQRPIATLCLLIGVLGSGCGTTMRFDLIRPARVTPPGPGTPYQVAGFEVPTMMPHAGPGMPGPGAPTTGGVVIVMPTPPAPVAQLMGAFAPADRGPYEVLRVDGSVQVARELSDGVASALRMTPSPNQILVPSGGRVLVGGRVLEAVYVETEDTRHTHCDREVSVGRNQTRTQRVPCIETTRRGDARIIVRARVWTSDGQVLFDEELSANTDVERTGRTAADGSWSEPPEPIVPEAVLASAIDRVDTELRHIVVPWREPVIAAWLDASGHEEHDRARELAGRGNFEESLTLLDVMLGTPGPRSADDRDDAHLLANRSVLRVAMGRYDEGLADMQAAVHRLPGCVGPSLLAWTREIVEEQDRVRAQGMQQPLGATRAPIP